MLYVEHSIDSEKIGDFVNKELDVGRANRGKQWSGNLDDDMFQSRL